MPDATPTPEEIEAQVMQDVAEGVQSFSEGGQSVSMMSPTERLKAAEHQRGNTAASLPHFGLRNTQLRSPGGGFE